MGLTARATITSENNSLAKSLIAEPQKQPAERSGAPAGGLMFQKGLQNQKS